MEKEFKFDMTVEEAQKEKKKIAQTIWDNMFCSGVNKLTKKQLILLVDALVERLDFHINLHEDWNCDERDFKDLFFDQKCIMIDCIDDKFFERDKE